MWKVKRMNRARIVVLAIAAGAGLTALYLASGSDNSAPQAPVAQLPTVDILVAKSDIGLGQTVKPDDLQWQTWPAATASNSFMRRDNKADAIKDVTGSIARAPFVAGEPIRDSEAGEGRRQRLHGRDPAQRHARGLDRNLAGDRRRRLHPAERPRRRAALQAREEPAKRRPGCRQHRSHPDQRPRARDRPGPEGERRHQRAGRQDGDARVEARADRDADPRAPDRHAIAGATQHRRHQRGRNQDRRFQQAWRDRERHPLRRRQSGDD